MQEPVSADFVHDLGLTLGYLVRCANEFDGPVDASGHKLTQVFPLRHGAVTAVRS